MTDKYSVYKDNDCVGICFCTDDCTYMRAFILVWSDNDSINSPFESIDDAELFAQMIVKLLEVVS